jgi:hypothetical protein
MRSTPWFRRRPRRAVAVAVAVFGAVLALRLTVGDPAEPVNLLYSLPIALLAVAGGRRGGLLGGVLAAALLASWAVLDRVQLSPLGWCGWLLPLLLLGGLLGDATDRLRGSQTELLRLETAAQRHRDAAEVNDGLVQGLTAAKWSLEAGDLDRGLQIITETSTRAQALVSELLRGVDRPRTTLPPRR